MCDQTISKIIKKNYFVFFFKNITIDYHVVIKKMQKKCKKIWLYEKKAVSLQQISEMKSKNTVRLKYRGVGSTREYWKNNKPF